MLKPMLKITSYEINHIALWYLTLTQCHLTVENNLVHCNGAFFTLFYVIFRSVMSCYLMLFLVIFSLLLIIYFDGYLSIAIFLLDCLFFYLLNVCGIASLLICDCFFICL